ncbi:MAG: hypothetical protein Q4F56_03320, partial [Candidatus Saccharibacteria bacterium]|nr:hypothetical protein [Candidatus Saccharibacteria bacterium]
GQNVRFIKDEDARIEIRYYYHNLIDNPPIGGPVNLGRIEGAEQEELTFYLPDLSFLPREDMS